MIINQLQNKSMRNSIKVIYGIILTIAFNGYVLSQNTSGWDGMRLVLDNGFVSRTVTLSEAGAFFTTSLQLKKTSNTNFVYTSGSREFSFFLNGKPVEGKTGWKVTGYKENSGETTISLKGITPELKDLGVDVTYVLYPGLPVIRKKLEIINSGNGDVLIESVNIECLSVPFGLTQTWIYQNFARQKWYGQLFRGNFNDPLVVVHNFEKKFGLALGNESPGVMKETSVLKNGNDISIGLTSPGETFAFQKWLRPAEKWESPWTFIIPYENENDPFEVVNITVSEFVRKHMRIRLAGLDEKPCFVYNTWTPFRTNLHDTLIRELTDVAAECGIEEFVIDDGWQNNYGDWEVDRKKFPDGLKPVFDYIKSKGMKPGLWISIASVSPNSNVYKQHPEWVLKSKSGTQAYIHSDKDPLKGDCDLSMNLSTEWLGYIKGKILSLVREHGLEYLKADLAVVTGAYTFDKMRSGDYSGDSPLYRTREESLLILYRRLWQLFDELHHEAPNLFIDCTFETMGSLHLIDYDMCKHAEGNWLSNIEDSFPTGAFRVRQLAWARTPVIPATAQVIGNLHLNRPDGVANLKSLIGTLPIVLGDLRELPPESRGKIREWANWLKEMQERHDFLMFRQDLPGFGEPTEGSWDGWSRINTETKTGGIAGVFKENAIEMERVVSVPFLLPDDQYEVRKAPHGELIGIFTGKELGTKGFRVKIEPKTGSELFEIKKQSAIK
jgi:alpha-galactosidase